MIPVTQGLVDVWRAEPQDLSIILITSSLTSADVQLINGFSLTVQVRKGTYFVHFKICHVIHSVEFLPICILALFIGKRFESCKLIFCKSACTPALNYINVIIFQGNKITKYL